jgi:hypothetical protein
LGYFGGAPFGSQRALSAGQAAPRPEASPVLQLFHVLLDQLLRNALFGLFQSGYLSAFEFKSQERRRLLNDAGHFAGLQGKKPIFLAQSVNKNVKVECKEQYASISGDRAIGPSEAHSFSDDPMAR